MRNPLTKRLPRELKSDFGKYAVIFLFMLLLISLVSGFLVADNSMIEAYNKSFEKYNVEDGHLAFNMENEEIIKALEEKADIKLYDMCYFEENIADTTKNVRVYKDRDTVNKVCLMSGEMPKAKDEIALDRMFAENNEYKVGDSIAIKNKTYRLTGLVALPDYSSLFENNTDMMFDSINFSVAILTEEGFNESGSVHLKYNYSWKYNDTSKMADDTQQNKASEELIDILTDVVKSYDEGLVDEAIAKGKLIFLDEIIESVVEATGYEKNLLDNEDGYKLVLDTVEAYLTKEGKTLSELMDIDKEVSLTESDVEAAFKMTADTKKEAQDFIDTVEDKVVTVEDYLPRYQNQAIMFTGTDMGGDKAMFIVFDYIVIAILAFIFAITTINTIVSEAGVIGTLRASGFTRGELIRHYMVLPVGVTLVAGVIGNILGYTVLKQSMIEMYYGSYSLTTYETLWNSEAFIITTVVPIIMMFLINLFVLWSKLKLSPLRFLRRDLSKRGRKKAFRLNTKIPFQHRFRLRIIFQNIPNYIVLFFGIFLGAVVMIFSLMFGPLLEDYADLIVETELCKYQYILSENVEIDEAGAEKYCMTTLKTTNEKFKIDDVSIYGIAEDSSFLKAEIPEGKVLISNAFANKFGLDVGDTAKLKDAYEDNYYEFSVAGIYTYDGAIAVFMNRADYIKTFGKSADYYTGYLSNEDLSSKIGEDNIYMQITEADLTKASTQLTKSMGDFMGLLKGFGVIMFLLVMYILSKQIIEKNQKSISIVKILGFTDGEIGGMYIAATSIVVVLSLLISIPLCHYALKAIFSGYMYTLVSGYIPFIIAKSVYVIMFVSGVLSYAAVAVLQMRKISKIPKSDALKNVE